MTSNLGSDIILNADRQGDIGFGHELTTGNISTTKEKVLKLLKEQFRPEFLNRIDDTIFFHALSEEDIAEIILLQLNLVSKRLLGQRRITLKVTERGKKLLAKKGFDPQFGARPLKREIQNLILDPLAMKIVTGEIPAEAKVTIDAVQDEIKIRTKSTNKQLAK